jgi:hypothetical protein
MRFDDAEHPPQGFSTDLGKEFHFGAPATISNQRVEMCGRGCRRERGKLSATDETVKLKKATMESVGMGL